MEGYAQLEFLRIVEVLPPRLSASGSKSPVGLDETIELFVRGVRSIRDFCDLVIVADAKSPLQLQLSPTLAASILQERAAVKAVPTLVARDSNRPQVRSLVLTALASGLESLFLVWGDNFPAGSAITNVRDYGSLSELISEAAGVSSQAGKKMRLFAPVDLDLLRSGRGVRLAKGRLKAGASLLLAQPPTTDADATFDGHTSILEENGLKDRVVLNVFPFRNPKDVSDMERNFGWSLPASLHAFAAKGEAAVVKVARDVVARARTEGFSGIHVSTRGTPELARKILG